MSEIEDMLAKQALWQKSRKDLGWYEKILLVERVRDSVESLRRSWVPPSSREAPQVDEDPRP